MLQKEFMFSFKIECRYLHVLTENNREKSAQSAYKWEAYL